jgi:glutamate dehydrogenase (NAD(P)+)
MDGSTNAALKKSNSSCCFAARYRWSGLASDYRPGVRQGDNAVRSYREIALEDASAGFGAYLVVDSSDKDISFGGTRIDMNVTRDMVVALADNMSLKLAGHGSPVGGAKAGLRASPDDPRLKQFLNQFAEECRELLSSTTILGKDMGAKQWMLDEIYKSLKMPQLGIARKRSQAAKCPDRLCDLDGYIHNMTGKGVFWSLEQALRGALSGARVLIQGFGVVGSGVAWHLHQSGARIVGVSDCRKAVLNNDGIDLDTLMAAKDDNGLLTEDKLPASWVLTERDELLAQCADVLVLAAGSYVVDGDIAARIQTPLVVEAANLALLPDARHRLHANAVRVVPDVVANSASAALVGHQIASGNTLSPQVLWADIEKNIKRSTDAADRVSKQLDVDSKTAFQRVIEAERNPSHVTVRKNS